MAMNLVTDWDTGFQTTATLIGFLQHLQVGLRVFQHQVHRSKVFSVIIFRSHGAKLPDTMLSSLIFQSV